MKARKLATLIIAILLVQGFGLSVHFGQAVTATVKGRVVDTDGTGLPGVVVLIKSKSQPTGNKQAVTDIEGNYRIQLLPPAGDYLIRVDYPGFAATEVGPLDLDPGKTTVVPITLRTTAETTEVITVESKGNIVDTDSTKTTTSYSAEFIEGLPIIGHNYQDILTLAPGVTDTDGDGNPNVHGARETGLQYRLDGGNITDPASGTFGQNLNSDIIEEVEVITSGASAEYGRADGGFANIITKSGGNEFEGKFSIYWQGKFLNGDGANNNDVNQFDSDVPDYRDIRPTLSLSGAIVKDKLWYFASVEYLDTEVPINQIGSTIIRTSKGNYSFGKLTWQVNSFNKLALQVNTDPRVFTGFGLALGVSPDSDFEFSQGGVTPQIKWTSTISPQLLLESQIVHFSSGISLTPVSDKFTPTKIDRVPSTNNTIQALYPCKRVNCDPAKGEDTIYQIDLFTNRVTGPYFFANDDSRTRNSIKTDLSYNVEDAWGQHNIKAGIEFADEQFEDNPTTNPIVLDNTRPFQDTSVGGGGTLSPDAIQGVQVVQTAEPLEVHQLASSFNSGIYLQDAWKPRPNLTLNLGVRLDREDVDTSGFEYFDPRQERRASIDLWRTFCEEAQVQGLATSANSNCHDLNTYDGKPPTNVPNDPTNGIGVHTFFDRDGDGTNDVDPKLISMDLNGDGIIDQSGTTKGTEGQEFYREFTRFADRETENFEINNTNLAPRISVSWDPWADGKTKTFGNWSRYYDRLFLDTIRGEIGPDFINYVFVPDPTTHILATSPTPVSRAASSISVTQIDRNIGTPYTDELSLGFERELAPEWSAGITYIKRKSNDLLQDVDLNHLTCEQHGEELGLQPYLICGNGPGSRLETDQFGTVTEALSSGTQGGNLNFSTSGVSGPNGAPDLYTVSPRFNQVLRIGNFNSGEYEAWELKILKRLHRNWQMQASYTWSESFGAAETFNSGLGNDPQTTDDEAGYLNFDQRHVVKFQAVTHLPHQITLGTIVQWGSGVPWSVIESVPDLDNTANTIFRTFFPTSQRNDQRNGGQWKLDARIDKNFVIGKLQASGYFAVENLLNEDWLVIRTLDTAAFEGTPLNATRNFGRFFEMGLTIQF